MYDMLRFELQHGNRQRELGSLLRRPSNIGPRAHGPVIAGKIRALARNAE